MRILIVDDSKAMRMIVKRALRGVPAARGATILEAGDGAEALRIIEDRLPHVVLCDWHMPGMSGIELLETLQEHESDIPFGFVTAEAHPNLRARALEGGARFWVTKPFTPDTLQRALSNVV